ncbi:MAG TPA: hypothetical protein PKL46_13280 [Aquabacterium sp.]|nr:hypothetical protein [Aquabacterium sp.]
MSNTLGRRLASLTRTATVVAACAGTAAGAVIGGVIGRENTRGK